MFRALPWYKRLFYAWFCEFAQMAESHQQGQIWNKKRCPVCDTPAASPEARYCAQCGMSLVTPTDLHPFAVESMQPFDDNERHTSAMRPVVIPVRPLQGARQVHNTKVLNAETLPLEVPEHIQQIIRKRRHIEAIVSKIRRGYRT